MNIQKCLITIEKIHDNYAECIGNHDGILYPINIPIDVINEHQLSEGRQFWAYIKTEIYIQPIPAPRDLTEEEAKELQDWLKEEIRKDNEFKAQ